MAKRKRTCGYCPWRAPFPTYNGQKYACHLTGYNVFEDQPCIVKHGTPLAVVLKLEEKEQQNEDN